MGILQRPVLKIALKTWQTPAKKQTNGSPSQSDDAVISETVRQVPAQSAPPCSDTAIVAVIAENKTGETFSKQERRRLMDQAEGPVIDIIAKGLWKLATVSSTRGEAEGSPDKEEALRAFNSGGSKPENAATFCSFVKRIIKQMNDYDIEMSCENRFRGAQSLGLRIFLCGIVLLDRVAALNTPITPRSLQRVVLTCMLTVSKFSEDEPLNNEFWAKAAFMQTKDLNKCELALVQLLGYRIRVSEEAYEGLLRQFSSYLSPIGTSAA